jgi:hypothetical protein
MAEITNKLLKQAIADAEAVRETAVANAKLVLEEAITPQIREMIARRLSAGALTEGDDEHEDEEDLDESDIPGEGEEEEGEEEEVRTAPRATAPRPTHKGAPVRDEAAKQLPHEDGTPVGGKDFPAKTSVVGKGDNRAPSGDAFDDSGIGGGPEGAGDSPEDWYDDWNESDFDLKEIVDELEKHIAELAAGDMEDDSDAEGYGDEEGHGDRHGDKEISLEEILAELDDEGDDAALDDLEHDMDEKEAPTAEAPSEEDDLKERVRRLMQEVNRLRKEQMQYEQAVNELRGHLNEVNLLNAKLLFTNKMFRKEGLTNEQKVRIVESFDRATTVREVKLVYAAIVENLSVAAKTLSNRASGRKIVAEGLASKPTRTTAPKQEVIVENTVAHRLKELAGII